MTDAPFTETLRRMAAEIRQGWGAHHFEAAAIDAALAQIDRLQIDNAQWSREGAKANSEILHERDKVEELARRADRFLKRAEKAEAEIARLERDWNAAKDAIDANVAEINRLTAECKPCPSCDYLRVPR